MAEYTVEATYGAMAGAAMFQAEDRGIQEGTTRPEVDVRRAPWWWVRGLQRTGRLPLLLGILGLDAAALLTRAQYPEADVPFWVFLLLPLTVAAVVVAVRGSWFACRLARIARRKTGAHVRYVLLHSHTSAAPWLVFFPGHGEEEAEPLGALKLSYGPVRHYYRDLPAAVGTAELSGEVRDGSVVVPWIGDRPVWPTDFFRELVPEDHGQIEFLSELTAHKPFRGQA